MYKEKSLHCILFWVKHASIAAFQPKQTTLTRKIIFLSHSDTHYGQPVEVPNCSNFDWKPFILAADTNQVIPFILINSRWFQQLKQLKIFLGPNHLDFSWKLCHYELETNSEMYPSFLREHLNRSGYLSKILCRPHFRHLGWPCFIKLKKRQRENFKATSLI